MEDTFTNVVNIVNNKKLQYGENIINEEDKLSIYKYYKQAIFGDCSIDKPDIMNYGKYMKWKVWNSIRGTSREDAMQLYVDIYQKLLNKYCLSFYFLEYNYI